LETRSISENFGTKYPARSVWHFPAWLLERGGAGELFATLRRGELEPKQAELLFSTEEEQVATPVPSGEGYELVRVLRRLPPGSIRPPARR
jgi:hypothetical protein